MSDDVRAPRVFPLAPMSPLLRAFTWAMFLVPLVFFGIEALVSPYVVAVFVAVALPVMALVYGSVWLVWRPTSFEVDGASLRICWPIRSRTIDRTTIRDVRFVSGAEFRREYGWGLRIGAGGLWGGFGLLKTRRETFSMWISRLDGFVLVRLRGARTLLLTPASPEELVRALTG